jgi:hypothetical protein
MMTMLQGCGTLNVGDQQLNDRYVYARSQVTPIRNVSASGDHTSYGLVCGFSREAHDSVYDKALSQAEGANLLLNVTTNYKTVYFPFICFNTLTISGLAAHSEVR